MFRALAMLLTFYRFPPAPRTAPLEFSELPTRYPLGELPGSLLLRWSLRFFRQILKDYFSGYA